MSGAPKCLTLTTFPYLDFSKSENVLAFIAWKAAIFFSQVLKQFLWPLFSGEVLHLQNSVYFLGIRTFWTAKNKNYKFLDYYVFFLCVKMTVFKWDQRSFGNFYILWGSPSPIFLYKSFSSASFIQVYVQNTYFLEGIINWIRKTKHIIKEKMV